MTTHELARVLLSAPEIDPARALVETRHGPEPHLITALVASEDEIEYGGLQEFGVTPGSVVIQSQEEES